VLFAVGLIALRRLAVRLPAACRLAPRMLGRWIFGMGIAIRRNTTTIKFGVYHFTDGVVYVAKELDIVFRELHITLLPFGTFITFLPHIFLFFNYTLKILEASARGCFFPFCRVSLILVAKLRTCGTKGPIIIGQKPIIIVHFAFRRLIIIVHRMLLKHCIAVY
jgi:hypothetical protein